MFCDKETVIHSSSPALFVVALVLAAFMGVQTWLLFSDRASISQTYDKQTEVMNQIEVAKNQVNNLMRGVLELSKKDNKNAVRIIDNLKKAGINFENDPSAAAPRAATPTPAPAPAASAVATPSKKK